MGHMSSPCYIDVQICSDYLFYLRQICTQLLLCPPLVSTLDGDCESDSYSMVFQPGYTSAELRIPILDDSLGVEGTEVFLATLLIPASSVYLGASVGSVDSATVSILDDDNVTVQFSVSEYEVSESAGEVTLYISIDTPGAVNYTLLVYLSRGTAEGECNMYLS